MPSLYVKQTDLLLPKQNRILIKIWYFNSRFRHGTTILVPQWFHGSFFKNKINLSPMYQPWENIDKQSQTYPLETII